MIEQHQQNEEDDIADDFVHVEPPDVVATAVDFPDNENANYSIEQLPLKMLSLEANVQALWAKNQMYKATIKHLEEKLKHLKEKRIEVEKNAKIKRVFIPKMNHWKCAINNVTISPNGLSAMTKKNRLHIYAEKGFLIFGCRKNNFHGTVVFYYEVMQTSASEKPQLVIGLSDGKIGNNLMVGHAPNSYAVGNGNDYCWLSDQKCLFELPNGGAIKPERNLNGLGDVVGCGLLVNAVKEMAIFFTENGILLGKPIKITHPGNWLYPTAAMWEDESLEANFGNDPNNPFKYDINKCPGLIFE